MSVLRSVLARDDVVDSDYSVAAVRIVYWAVLEVNLSIIIACVPTLAPLAAKLCPGLVVTPRTNDSADGRPPTISSAPIRLRSVENIGG